MLAHEDLTGVLAFVGREGWTPLFEAVLAEHYGQPSASLDRDVMMGAWTTAFEDFATRSYDGEGNVVDAWLAGPGRTETARIRAGFTALRHSVPGVYEVVETKVGRTMTLRDLAMGGHMVTIADRGLHFAGCWVVTRLVRVQGRLEASRTVLGFTRPADQAEMKALLAKSSGRVGPEITRLWVRQAMGKAEKARIVASGK